MANLIHQPTVIMAVGKKSKEISNFIRSMAAALAKK
jgi:hypothetical protein